MDYNSIKNLISTPYWKQLEEYLDYLEGVEKDKLVLAESELEIHRLQGAVRMLRYMKNLRNQYVK